MEIDDSCATYQLDWTHYVLYQVFNETFATVPDENEVYEGKLARRYTSSRLLQLVLGKTHATNENPGRLIHYEVICEDHVVNVICAEPPLCLKSGPGSRIQCH